MKYFRTCDAKRDIILCIYKYTYIYFFFISDASCIIHVRFMDSHFLIAFSDFYRTFSFQY